MNKYNFNEFDNLDDLIEDYLECEDKLKKQKYADRLLQVYYRYGEYYDT